MSKASLAHLGDVRQTRRRRETRVQDAPDETEQSSRAHEKGSGVELVRNRQSTLEADHAERRTISKHPVGTGWGPYRAARVAAEGHVEPCAQVVSRPNVYENETARPSDAQ